MSFCKHRVMDRCKKDGRPCIFSPDCLEPEEEKHMTNADRFRAMSDEEQQNCVRRFSEIEDFADWLQQPAEGD